MSTKKEMLLTRMGLVHEVNAYADRVFVKAIYRAAGKTDDGHMRDAVESAIYDRDTLIGLTRRAAWEDTDGPEYS